MKLPIKESEKEVLTAMLRLTMTTTGRSEDDTTTLLVLVLLGAEPQSQTHVQNIEFGQWHARDVIELVASGTEVSVIETTSI